MDAVKKLNLRVDRIMKLSKDFERSTILGMKDRIEIFLRGGLGNQLFQYSLGLQISKIRGVDLVIREDLLPLFEDKIGQVSRWPNQISGFKHSGQVVVGDHQPEGATDLFGKLMQVQRMIGDVALPILMRFGVLASEKRGLPAETSFLDRISSVNSYATSASFAKINRTQILQEVNSIISPSSTFKKLSLEIEDSMPTVVHLRRGDYLALKDIYGEISVDYLKNALNSVSASNDQPIWLFTQDRKEMDSDTLSTLMPEKIIDSSDLPSPLETMALMAKGDGLICSNSTFSWWAAFLKVNNGAVVVPNFGAIVNVFSTGMVMDGWITLRND
jgi:hypothetical protein